MVAKLQYWHSLFFQSTMWSDVTVWIGWALVSGLKYFVDLTVQLFDAVYGVLDFTQYAGLNSLFSASDVQTLLIVLFAIALVWLGIILIFQKEGNRSKLLQNALIAVLVITALPNLMMTLNQLTQQSEQYFIGQSDSLSDQIIASGVKDLKYMDSKGFDNYTITNGVVQGKSSSYALNGFSGSDLPNAAYINPTEKITDQTSGIKSHDLFFNSLTIDDSGKPTANAITKNDPLGIIDLTNWYYRYSIDFLYVIVALLATAIAIFFGAIKAAKLIFELVVHKILAVLFAASDFNNGQRAIQVLKSLIGMYFILIYLPMTIKLYQVGIIYLTQNVSMPLAKAFIMFVFAMAVISGPNIVEKVIGVDAGLSSGFRSMAGFLMGARTAAGVAKGAAHGGLKLAGATAGAVGGIGGGFANSFRNQRQNLRNTSGGNSGSERGSGGMGGSAGRNSGSGSPTSGGGDSGSGTGEGGSGGSTSGRGDSSTGSSYGNISQNDSGQNPNGSLSPEGREDIQSAGNISGNDTGQTPAAEQMDNSQPSSLHSTDAVNGGSSSIPSNVGRNTSGQPARGGSRNGRGGPRFHNPYGRGVFNSIGRGMDAGHTVGRASHIGNVAGNLAGRAANALSRNQARTAQLTNPDAPGSGNSSPAPGGTGGSGSSESRNDGNIRPADTRTSGIPDVGGNSEGARNLQNGQTGQPASDRPLPSIPLGSTPQEPALPTSTASQSLRTGSDLADGPANLRAQDNIDKPPMRDNSPPTIGATPMTDYIRRDTVRQADEAAHHNNQSTYDQLQQRQDGDNVPNGPSRRSPNDGLTNPRIFRGGKR